MARKTLLTEAELRSFMKLAELTPLGADRIAEIYGTDEDLEEGEDRDQKKKKPMREEDDDSDDDDPPGMGRPMREGDDDEDDDPPGMGRPMREGDDDDDDDPPGMGMRGGKSMEEEMDMDAMDMDDDAADDIKMDMGMDAPAAGGDSKMVSIDDFMGALEDALEQVLGDDVEVEMDDEDDDDIGMEDDDPMGMDDDPAGMRGMGGGDQPAPMSEEDIVNEVARRVAARLQDKHDKEQMVEQLAERILNRLTSK